MSEPLVSASAAKWKVEVNTAPDPATPTWTQVRGIGECVPGQEDNLEDDSDYDAVDGWQSQVKTGAGWQLELTVVRKKGLTSGNYDAGQEKLRALSGKILNENVAFVRWYDRNGGPEAYTGYAAVGWKPKGGKGTDLETIEITLFGRGERTEIANPAA